jgi:hypothetical protein
MHAVRIDRASVTPADLLGRLICHDLRSDDGRIAIPKGRVLDEDDSALALTLEWTELHLLALDERDVHEEAAGHRIAHAVSGPGVEVRPQTGGHWPLAAAHRGVLAIDGDALIAVNDLDGPCVYSLLDGQVVDTGEVIARAKLIPFAVSETTLASVDSIAAASAGVLRVHPFVTHRVGGVVHASLGDRAIGRFRSAVAEKIGWFGSTLGALEVAGASDESIADAFRAVANAGVDVILVAGTKAMDVLDPTFAALERVGARMIRHGLPAHPGSLLWLAEWNGTPIVGMPTCGLFAQATVFDLIIARILTGERLERGALSKLAQGGFLTRDMAFRLPAYRQATARGAVE